MEVITPIQSPKGTYTCEIGVTVEEWKKVLLNKDITTSNYKEALLAFYNEPGHKATCKQLGLKCYGGKGNYQKFNSWITSFGKVVVKHFNRFRIIHSDGSDVESFWNVAMNPGVTIDSGEFQWTLRAELVQAIEELGWNKIFTWVPFYMELADKLLLYKDNRAALIDVVYSLDDKFVKHIKEYTENDKIEDIDPFSVIAIFNRGISNDNRLIVASVLKEKLDIKANLPSDFAGIPIVDSRNSILFGRENVHSGVQPLWDFFAAAINGDRDRLRECFDIVRNQKGIKWNITMILFWIRPYEYISLDSVNQAYLPSLGISVFKDSNLNAEHYFKLLDEVIEKIETHSIKETSIPEISYNAWKGDENMTTWLLGYTFNESESQYDRFINEHLWEGIFRDTFASDQKLLKQAREIKRGDVIILKSTGTKGKNHDQSFLRIKAVGVVEDDVSESKIPDNTSCICHVNYLSTEQKDFDGGSYGSLRKTLHKLDPKYKDLVDYIKSILRTEEKMNEEEPKYDKYIKLLKANKNLVLTGAPGTGKTYMANEIAKAMNAEVKFVQFHPSYDYTDFVEGLRPVDTGNGQIGFERKDGVFKKFCKEALKNLEDSKKSVEALEKELSWQEQLMIFVEDSIENETAYNLTNGSEFTIVDMSEHAIMIHNEHNEKTSNIVLNADEVLYLLNNEINLHNVRDIKQQFNRKYSTQQDSYVYVIVNILQNASHVKREQPSDVEKVNRKDFVFIIDEINRGEASKIFGELFYAIDPDYRGKKEVCVQTQYQNLIHEADVFAKGFYVPENVYILATMNDIDRSVESMDFAMRRRFTWKEITPSDTDYMLDVLGDTATEAKSKMNKLNEAIASTDGLGTAYAIGPSYFLKLGEYAGDFNVLWELNIEPLLREYLRGFRKASDVMKRFETAYFENKQVGAETTTEEDVIDED